MKVINQTVLDELPALIERWKSARPIPHVVIDNFVSADRLMAICDAYPAPSTINRSRDYMFGKEKYEKNNLSALGDDMAALCDDLLSEDFAQFLSALYGKEVFVDPDFHGGGLHMGGEGSYLDMHADFNVHPKHNWLRELNILLYVNPSWRPEYGGQLKLRNAETGEFGEIEPLFNRCVIMLTKDHTLHGYDPIRFPPGTYRKSIAAYAYSVLDKPMKARSTKWQSDHPLRRAMGPVVGVLVNVKNAIFGSGSEKNR